jgi:hypothetical protein
VFRERRRSRPGASAAYNPPRSKPLLEWRHIHAELRRRSVTLALLWEEYRGQRVFGIALGYEDFHVDDAPDLEPATPDRG